MKAQVNLSEHYLGSYHKPHPAVLEGLCEVLKFIVEFTGDTTLPQTRDLDLSCSVVEHGSETPKTKETTTSGESK